jgi:hypothetical protein
MFPMLCSTWSRRRALIDPFLALNNKIKSAALGSWSKASGPSSEIGGTFSGCKIHQEIVTIILLNIVSKAWWVIEKSKDPVFRNKAHHGYKGKNCPGDLKKYI